MGNSVLLSPTSLRRYGGSIDQLIRLCRLSPSCELLADKSLRAIFPGIVPIPYTSYNLDGGGVLVRIVRYILV
jgi:hypothetical protein